MFWSKQRARWSSLLQMSFINGIYVLFFFSRKENEPFESKRRTFYYFIYLLKSDCCFLYVLEETFRGISVIVCGLDIQPTAVSRHKGFNSCVDLPRPLQRILWTRCRCIQGAIYFPFKSDISRWLLPHDQIWVCRFLNVVKTWPGDGGGRSGPRVFMSHFFLDQKKR